MLCYRRIRHKKNVASVSTVYAFFQFGFSMQSGERGENDILILLMMGRRKAIKIR